MKPYCIFEDGQPYQFAEDWQEVLRLLMERCRSSNQYVVEMHNQFIGPFYSGTDLCSWLAELNGSFDRAIVIHPTNVPPVFMITHLVEPRVPGAYSE